MSKTTLLMCAAALVGTLALAADPPETINYQGVLRDSADNPLAGTYSMVFRFCSAETGGDEILVDTHDAVTVSSGLFTVRLGSGTVTDGTGPGEYTSLSRVHADYADLYLEVQVGGEILTPRLLLSAMGSALNSRYVRGQDIISDGPIDVYVDDDTCPQVGKGTLADPYCRIQEAVDFIPAIITGDVVIHVAEGTYTEEVRITRRPQPTTPGDFGSITLEGNVLSPSAVVLDGETIRADGISVGGALYVVISGIKVTGFTDEAVNIGAHSTVQLQDCEVMGNSGVGIDVFSADAFLSDCTVSNNANWGIDLGRSYMEIDGTTVIRDNGGGYGIKAWGNSYLALKQDSTITFDQHLSSGDVAVRVDGNSHMSSKAVVSFGSNVTALEVIDNSSVAFHVDPSCTGNTQDFVASYNATIRGHGGLCGCTVSPNTDALCRSSP